MTRLADSLLRSLLANKFDSHRASLSFISILSSSLPFSQKASFVSDKPSLLRFAAEFEHQDHSATQALRSDDADEMAKSKGGYYAVQKGRQKGVYATWTECEAQTKGFAGSVFKKFPTKEQAEMFARASSGYGWSSARLDAPSGSDYKHARQAHREQKQQAREHVNPPTPTADEESSTSSAALDYGSHFKAQSAGAVSQATSALQSLPDRPPPIRPFQKGVSPRLALPTHSGTETSDIFTLASSDNIIAYCDGSSISNGKSGARAGWGVYFENPHMQHMNESRRLTGNLQTNNRAELMALIRAIQLCYQVQSSAGRQLVLMTDSQYSMDCVNKWIGSWKRREWKTSTGTDVLNKDLIEILDEELLKHVPRPKLVKVKAHSGIEGNEIVDRMAKFGASLPKTDSADLGIRSFAPESHLMHPDLI